MISQDWGYNRTPLRTPPPTRAHLTATKTWGSLHCSLQVPGDHPHPPDGPPRVQLPVGAEGCQGDFQEGHPELCGKGGGIWEEISFNFLDGGGGEAGQDVTPSPFFLPPQMQKKEPSFWISQYNEAKANT